MLKPADEIKTSPPPPPFTVGKQIVSNELREAWGDYVYWDRDDGRAEGGLARRGRRASSPASRASSASVEVTLVDGTTVTVRPAFDLLKEYLDESFDLPTTAEVCTDPAGGRSRASPGSSPRTRARPCSPRAWGRTTTSTTTSSAASTSSSPRSPTTSATSAATSAATPATTAARSSRRCRSGSSRTRSTSSST